MDEARLSVELEGGSSWMYDPDERKFTLKFVHPDLEGAIELVVQSDCGEGVKLGTDGSYYYNTEKTQFWRFAMFPRVAVTGTGLGKDLSGVGFVGRTTTNIPIYSLNTRSAHLKLFNDKHMLTMMAI